MNDPRRKIILGCIADDFTGATDLANNLVRAGMRVVQTVGVPAAALDIDADAVVVALKSRTIAAADAVAQSLDALTWLRSQGARQVYFKICSTFDSTPAGNIGPVTDALMQALGARFAVATPAFPDNGRTVFKGHLFVGDVLLGDSGMRHHPLTPMTDSNLVRVMQAQTAQRVGLIDHTVVAAGAKAIARRMAEMQAEGVGIAMVDAVCNDDLLGMATAFSALPLLVAGSGLAIGLPAAFGIAPSKEAADLPPAGGLRAIVSGSCSSATNAQVKRFIEAGHAAHALDVARLSQDAAAVVQEALAWAIPLLGPQSPVLVYSTAVPAAVQEVQRELGADAAGALVEHALAGIARGLVAAGVRQLVVAGGETSGACVQALGITQMKIGGQIDPGVPWCHAAVGESQAGGQDDHGLHIALKSGNFGGPDFFSRAFGLLQP